MIMSYTVKQAAELLGLHKTSVIDRIRKGLLKAKKIPITTAFTWEIDEQSLIDNLSMKAKRKRGKYAKSRTDNY